MVSRCRHRYRVVADCGSLGEKKLLVVGYSMILGRDSNAIKKSSNAERKSLVCRVII